MSHFENISRIKEQVVFVGGATVSLYADRNLTEVRPTDDVDILVELLDYQGYADIEEKLRAKGFKNDIESGVICRYIVQGIVVDVMPTSEKILGFANHWYKLGYATSINHVIDENYTVRIFRPEYFLASKLVAFQNRGRSDGRTSSDFEDIIFVLNYRTTIWTEIQAADAEVNEFILSIFKELLANPYFDEWISAHLEYSEQRRVNFILGGLTDLVMSE